jgi:hypothetical protein
MREAISDTAYTCRNANKKKEITEGNRTLRCASLGTRLPLTAMLIYIGTSAAYLELLDQSVRHPVSNVETRDDTGICREHAQYSFRSGKTMSS